MGEEGGDFKGVWKREEMCFEAGEELTVWKRQCVGEVLERCWRGGCRNLLRERPEIGGKIVPKMRRSVSERAIGEFELGCEWRKSETDVIGWSSFASEFDIDKLAKVTGLRFMKEIVGNGDYFELNMLFDPEPMKLFNPLAPNYFLPNSCRRQINF